MIKKIIVFLPVAGIKIPSEFFESYLKARTYFQYNTEGYELAEFVVKLFPTSESRNYCVGKMKEGFTHYSPDISIWLDVDHEIPHDTLVRLIKPDKPIVSGIYYLKTHPYQPIVFRRGDYCEDTNFYLVDPIVDYPDRQMFKADAVGMGCVRIDKEVFDALEPPYFEYRPHSKHELHASELDFKIRHHIRDNTEELAFWEQVKEKGFEIWVDPELQLIHLGSKKVSKQDYNYSLMSGVFGDINELSKNKYGQYQGIGQDG